jgi:hypothetical protein
VRFSDRSEFPGDETLYEDVYVRSPYIHLKSAERDPAWKAAQRQDRVPATKAELDAMGKAGG